MATHYEILGVSPTASTSEIKAAHRKLALRLHPDKRNNSSISTSSSTISKCDDAPIQTAKNLGDIDIDADTHESISERLEKVKIKATISQHDATTQDTTSDDQDDADDANFRRIQLAWECLRDPSRRKQYDEELKRSNHRSTSKVEKAVVVKLSDMEVELCEVEQESGEEPEGGSGDITRGAHDESNSRMQDDDDEDECLRVYIYTCRCGDEIEILEEDLTVPKEQQDTVKDEGINVFECQSCCLCIRVDIDIALGRNEVEEKQTL